MYKTDKSEICIFIQCVYFKLANVSVSWCLKSNFKKSTPINTISNLKILLTSMRSLQYQCCFVQGLHYLVLNDNQFDSVPDDLEQYRETLEVLLLRKNRIAELDVSHLSRLNNLTVLELSMNNLSEMPADVARLGSLTQLFLNNNNFDQFPVSILALDKLTVNK